MGRVGGVVDCTVIVTGSPGMGDETTVLSIMPGPVGDVFPARSVFARYVADRLAPVLADGRVAHRRATVRTVTAGPEQAASWPWQRLYPVIRSQPKRKPMSSSTISPR